MRLSLFFWKNTFVKSLRLSKVSIIISGCLLSTMAFGQKDPFQVMWGKEFKVPKEAKHEYKDGYGERVIVGSDETGFYILADNKVKGNSITIQHFDRNLSQIRTQEIELKSNGADEEYEFILQWEKELWLFSSQINTDLKQNNLFARRINKSKLLPEGTALKVGSMSSPELTNKNSGSFFFNFSSDSSKLLLKYSPPQSKGERERIGIQVLNNSLETLWHRNVTLPRNDEFSTSAMVDNNGNVYQLGWYSKDYFYSVIHNKPDYVFRVYLYSNNASEDKEYLLSPGDVKLINMNMKISEKGDLVCFGFYSSIGKLSARGTYYARISTIEKKIVTSKLEEFGFDFLTQYMGEDEAKKLIKKEERNGDIEMKDYFLRRTILLDDGGLIAVAERKYVAPKTQYSSGGIYYRDVIVVKIDSNGNIKWNTRIYRISNGGYGSYEHFSYALAVVGDKIYILYNDNKRNVGLLKYVDLKTYTGTEEGIIIAAQVDSLGTLKKFPVWSSLETRLTMVPAMCEQISKNEILTIRTYASDRQLAKITFED